jgi:ubiquinone/menaquinone biosynthesis C-methylase UbiE
MTLCLHKDGRSTRCVPPQADPFLDEAPQEVLEVGCGTGYFTSRVAAALPASRVTGLDPDGGSPSRASTPAADVKFERGDLAALPYPDGRFDLVSCRFVLVHLSDP